LEYCIQIGMIDSVVAVAIQNILYLKIYQNNIFKKNYF
jgi:hypothetical protein